MVNSDKPSSTSTWNISITIGKQLKHLYIKTPVPSIKQSPTAVMIHGRLSLANKHHLQHSAVHMRVFAVENARHCERRERHIGIVVRFIIMCAPGVPDVFPRTCLKCSVKRSRTDLDVSPLYSASHTEQSIE